MTAANIYLRKFKKERKFEKNYKYATIIIVYVNVKFLRDSRNTIGLVADTCFLYSQELCV